MHVSFEIWPTAELKEPVGHRVQLPECPTSAEKNPAGHSVQLSALEAASSKPKRPATHAMQLEALVAPEKERYKPGEHEMHPSELRPISALYFPSSQSWQVVMSVAFSVAEYRP